MISRYHYYHFDIVEKYRQKLLSDRRIIDFEEMGSGKVGRYRKPVAVIARHSAVTRKYGRLLARLVAFSRPDTMLELGTSLGVGSLYMGLSRTSARFITVEGNSECASIAANTLKEHGCANAEVVCGNFNSVLPKVLQSVDTLDFVWFDGNHQEIPTLDYFNQCVAKASDNAVFVFDDINYSQGMYRAWTTIVNHPRVTVSIELYRAGIVFFRKECKKQHFRLRW